MGKGRERSSRGDKLASGQGDMGTRGDPGEQRYRDPKIQGGAGPSGI